MRMFLVAAAIIALPLSTAFAQTTTTTGNQGVLSQNMKHQRPGLGDHHGGAVRVRSSYAGHSLNNKNLNIMFNQHGG